MGGRLWGSFLVSHVWALTFLMRTLNFLF
jgi:hypothetical protein